MNKNILKRIVLKINSPPPFMWMTRKVFFKSYLRFDLINLVFAVLQQFRWWFISPIYFFRKRNLNNKLPLSLIFKACWLNSFTIREVSTWLSIGMKNWDQISNNYPNNLSVHIHNQRRRNWAGNCRGAIKLLANKEKLLSITPKKWTPPFMLINHRSIKGNPDISLKPKWWDKSLKGKGIILKPNEGCAAKRIIHFKYNLKSKILSQEFFFTNKKEKISSCIYSAISNPIDLFKLYKEQYNNNDLIIATPYLTQGCKFPKTFPSTVLRIVTFKEKKSSAIKIDSAWFEIPLGNTIGIISIKNKIVPIGLDKISIKQKKHLRNWVFLIRSNLKDLINDYLQASKVMHSKLPPIDSVAWDWIPTNNNPTLLEGNSNYALFIPQVIKKSYKR